MADIIYKDIIESMTWSYSRLTSYDDCPYQWFLKYITEEDKIKNFYAEYGKLIHDLLDLYYKDIITKEEMLMYFYERFPYSVQGDMPSLKIVKSYMSKGEGYLQNFQPLNYTVIETEKEIKFTVGEKPFIGFIDFIGRDKENDKIVIVDHKSRNMKQRSKKGRYTQGDQLIDDMLRQLYLYSIAIKEEYGEYPSKLVFNCFNNGQLIIEDFKPDVLEETKEWAVNTIKRIENTEEFPPYPDYFKCRFLCDMKNECYFADKF